MVSLHYCLLLYKLEVTKGRWNMKIRLGKAGIDPGLPQHLQFAWLREAKVRSINSNFPGKPRRRHGETQFLHDSQRHCQFYHVSIGQDLAGNLETREMPGRVEVPMVRSEERRVGKEDM